MRGMTALACMGVLLTMLCGAQAQAQGVVKQRAAVAADSSHKLLQGADTEELRNAWGVDILVSDGGFGLGAFYRREFSDEWFGFTSLSVSESKDDKEVEQFDYYGQSYVPGKLNRFLVIPWMFGVQRRLFKDEITDNFRPYVNAGAGPTMIYVTPFTNIITTGSGPIFEQVDFFKALGKGHPEYTLGAFVGFGANFGTEKSNLLGVNFRYYFTYLLGSPLPSLYNLNTGSVSGTKKNFGGFFITLNVGMAY